MREATNANLKKRRLAARAACALLACAMLCLPLAGCGKREQQEPSVEEEAPAATQSEAGPVARRIGLVSDTLVGFVIPATMDGQMKTTLHGFLRTAESLGYPAKAYYAPAGAQAVAAVEQASSDGCAGLLVWNANSVNDEAIARAQALSLPVVVPYHESSAPGVEANVAADLVGYAEEIALGVAQRMEERECKAGKILVYGSAPFSVYERFVTAIEAYYPIYNVAYFTRAALGEEAAIEELATHILWNRDIKGLFCTDADGASIAVRARENASRDFKANGAPEAPSQTPSAKQTPSPTPAPASPGAASLSEGAGGQQAVPGATPVPEGLLKSITITVAGYGLEEDAEALLRSNDIQMLVVEPYYEAGAQSMMLLERILRGESVPEKTRLNMPIARLATVEKYALIRDQVQEWFQ